MDHGNALLITVVASIGFGLLAQILAHKWHFPAIVLLLGFGILLGDNVLGIVKPQELGDGLVMLVKLSVAIILFEGALNLNLRSLRQSAAEVRNLVTIGVLISWVATTLVTRFVAGLDWSVAVLFGSLMTVTGPTVVQPLLRRASIPKRVKTILEGEAILIDPVGAILAIAVLDVLLANATRGSSNIVGMLWAYFGRLLIGATVGGVGALFLSRIMNARRWIPSELSNLVALAGVLGTFGAAELVLSESGIMAVVIMGLIIQNVTIPGERQLKRFKETLTTLGISVLFILLAARLDLASLWAEGAKGLAVVVLIMFAVRPLGVFTSTWGSTLRKREKIFIAWIGPRGIIAASVASIFAVALEEAGMAGGDRLLALTFLTIILTVVVEGLSAKKVAHLLRIDTFEGKKVIIIGANRLGIAIAELLTRYERPVILLDTNRTSVERANQAGLKALFGNALEEDVLENLHAEEAATLLAMTSNSEVNVLACQFASDSFGIERAYPVLSNPAKGANPKLLRQTGGRLAFGRYLNLIDWEYNEIPYVEVEWKTPTKWIPSEVSEVNIPPGLLPVIRKRNAEAEIVHADQLWQPGDAVIFFSRLDQSEAEKRLMRLGNKSGI